MNANNAIKKLQKAGFTVTESNRTIIGRKEGHYNIECSRNGGNYSHEIATIGQRIDKSDPQSDYCGLCFYDNLTQAINHSARFATAA